MKKKLNAGLSVATPDSTEPPARRHGPLKEKVQITVRLDQDLMQRAYVQMAEHNTRLTDLVERGLELALTEQDQVLPPMTNKVRFLVNNTTKAQQVYLRSFLAFLVMPEVRKLTAAETLWHRSFLDYLDSLEENLFPECFKLYQRYAQITPEVQHHPTGS